MWQRIVVSLCALCLSTLNVAGAAGDDASLQQTILASFKSYQQAFADRNAESLASLFTEENEYIDASGTVFHGREAVQAEVADSFAAESAGTLEMQIALPLGATTNLPENSRRMTSRNRCPVHLSFVVKSGDAGGTMISKISYADDGSLQFAPLGGVKNLTFTK